MTSTRTRVLLGLYIQAFHSLASTVESGPLTVPMELERYQRDQPSFRIALLAMLKHSETTEYSNKMVQELSQLESLQHVDLPFEAFCRGKTTPNSFPLKSCLFAHKARCRKSEGCSEDITFNAARKSWAESKMK